MNNYRKPLSEKECKWLVVSCVVVFVIIILSAKCYAAETIKIKVTAYCWKCKVCCGKWAAYGPNRKTAGGVAVKTKMGAASAWEAIPKGTKIKVPGHGTVTIDDKGGAMRQSWKKSKTYHIDLRFDNHADAKNWGVQWIELKKDW